MNFNNIKNSISSSAGKSALRLEKVSPSLMFGAGIVGMVGTVVLASKATLHLEDILDETEVKKEQAAKLVERGHQDYSEKDYEKDMQTLKVRQIARIAKLYAPAFGLGVISVGLLTGAHVQLNRRNAALMAAYATLEKGFNRYRENVISEYGDDKDREFMFGVDEVERTEKDDKGRDVVNKHRVAGGPSMYARFFEPSNPNWNPTPETNLFFLKMHQQQLNNQLQARGHVILNEVYDALGMERTKEGCVVGWVKGNGDDYIDFGIWEDEQTEKTLDFLCKREDCLLLDFNVDGVVYDKI